MYNPTIHHSLTWDCSISKKLQAWYHRPVMWLGSCLVVTSPLRLEISDTMEPVLKPPLRTMVVGLTWENRRQWRRLEGQR